MPTDYSQFLTKEQRQSLLTQRLQQFAAEAYQHEINHKVATETGDAAGQAAASEALQILDKAIEVHVAELESLT